MERLRTPRLLLRHWEESDLPAVAARLRMSDEGTTDRWFGLTARQFRKVTIGRCQTATPG
jgi:hypothetical protein